MPPTVNPYRLSGDEIAIEEPQHALRDFELAAPPAQRRRLLDGFELLVGRAGRREDWAGRNRVDEDVVARELERERLGQRDHAALRHVVRQIAPVSRPAASRKPV